MQPGFGDLPVALNCPGRNPKHLANFLLRQPAEETQLHYLSHTRITLRQTVQGLIDRDPLFAIVVTECGRRIEFDLGLTTAALFCPTASRMVDKDAAHNLSGRS